MSLRSQPPHLLLKRLAIVHDILGAHIPPGCQNEAVLPDLFNRSTLAEPWHVRILPDVLLAPPCVVRRSNPRNILISEIAVYPVDQRPHLPGVDEERLATAIPEPVVLFLAGDKPEANRDLVE